MQLPRQYIHVQPFSTDNDLPDYDLDEEDCAFLDKVLKDEKKFDVDESTFEGMLDRSVNEGKTIGYCLKDTNTKADVFIVICSKYFQMYLTGWKRTPVIPSSKFTRPSLCFKKMTNLFWQVRICELLKYYFDSLIFQ